VPGRSPSSQRLERAAKDARGWGGGKEAAVAPEAAGFAVAVAAGAEEGFGAEREAQGWESARSRGIQAAAAMPPSQRRAQGPEGLAEEEGAMVSWWCCRR
jgi:hypothetical protein